MDSDERDDERDEAITAARISGTSSRGLAKLHGCTGREIEEAIDRSLNYELDNRQRLRLVKLSVARIEGLMLPFYEKAVRDKDVAAGTLCCKLEERLALLLGLDHPAQARIDMYQVSAQQQPKRFDKIYEAIMRIRDGEPPSNGNGDALAPPINPSADDQNRSDSK